MRFTRDFSPETESATSGHTSPQESQRSTKMATKSDYAVIFGNRYIFKISNAENLNCLCKKVKTQSKDKILSAVKLGKLANDFFKKPTSRGSLILLKFYTSNVGLTKIYFSNFSFWICWEQGKNILIFKIDLLKTTLKFISIRLKIFLFKCTFIKNLPYFKVSEYVLSP